MINLLPPKEKEVLFMEQTRKLVVILGTIVLIAIVCLVLVLLPVYFFVLGDVESQKIFLKEAEDKYKTEDFENYRNIIANYNKSFPRIISVYESSVKMGDVMNNVYFIAGKNLRRNIRNLCDKRRFIGF